MRTGIQYLISRLLMSGLVPGLLISTLAYGVDKPYPGPYVENEKLLVILIPRTPEQMAAFYEARGFPKKAIAHISSTCFVTVHIENKSRQVIWLETGNWSFTSNKQSLQRLDTGYWDRQWDAIDLPLANRSTFGWTQLPTVRDLQPGEPVGGNIIFPGTTRLFDIDMRFLTGNDKRDGMLDIRFSSVECLKNQSEP